MKNYFNDYVVSASVSSSFFYSRNWSL